MWQRRLHNLKTNQHTRKFRPWPCLSQQQPTADPRYVKAWPRLIQRDDGAETKCWFQGLAVLTEFCQISHPNIICHLQTTWNELKNKKKRDTAVGNWVGKWAHMNVWYVASCLECGLPRCFFVQRRYSQIRKRKCWNPPIEKTASFNLWPRSILPDDSILHELIFTTDTPHPATNPTKKEYYITQKTTIVKFFITPAICALCASDQDVLLDVGLDKLFLTDGYPCLPMHTCCKKSGIKPSKEREREREMHEE